MLKTSWAKLFFLCFLALTFVRCSFYRKKPEQNAYAFKPTDVRLVKKFNTGSKYMDEGHYELAIESFKSILVQHPASDLEIVTYFNLGASYEALKKCKKAARYYRKVTRLGHGKFKKIEAQAFFRLGYAYLCSGRPQKALAAFTDAWLRKDYLPLEKASAILPAQMGLSYILVGNEKEAKKYFERAWSGLLKVSKSYKVQKLKLEKTAQTMYLMGLMDHVPFQKMDPQRYLKAIYFMQAFLLKAVEMDVAPWSQKASRHLLESHDRVWLLVKRLKKNKKFSSSQRILQKKRNALITKALGNVEKLKALRFPEDMDKKIVKELFRKMAIRKKRFIEYLSKNTLETPLTTEAKRRQQLRQKGRTYRPNPILEEKSLKSNKKL
ncbi:MAG: hypothetical protein D6797_03680 [Bdellovibrio sp.]|nr:MAG: hypothetical protein D6797_03680 [Bdellovibrio sp.]